MAMLDLNVDIISCDSDNVKEEKMEVEYSGTSKSSVVNSDETANLISDKNSLNKSSSTFIFDIMKKATQEDARKENLEPEIITRSFFPVSGDTGGRDFDFKLGFSASSRPSEAAGGQAESKILQQKQPHVRKNRRGPRSRSSQYRGVTFYRRTGRWESHIWDCGKQVYLGGFDTAHSAARAYDRAAIKFRGVNADINFSLSDYEEDLKQMRNLTKEEFVRILRRRSTGSPRGSSKYKNVAHQKFGQLEPRVGQFLSKKVYEKPRMEWDGRDGATSFEPINYQRGIILDPSRGGDCHNLDLKLGISPPSKELKGNNDNDGATQFSFHYAVGEIINKGGPTGDSSAHPFIKGQAIYGLTMAPKFDQIYPAVYPSYSQNYEERDREKKLEAIPLPRISNWAWQLHSNGNIMTVPVFSSAASSGFASSSNNALSSAQLPTNPNTKSFYNYYSATASTINSPSL